MITSVLLIGIEEKHTLHKVLVEHARVPDTEEVSQTELRKAAELRVHEATHKVEEERPFPLDVVLLQQAGEQSERLSPDEERVLLEAGGDGVDVGVDLGGVAHGQVAQDHDNVVACGLVRGRQQFLCHLDYGLLGQVLVLEAEFP